MCFFVFCKYDQAACTSVKTMNSKYVAPSDRVIRAGIFSISNFLREMSFPSRSGIDKRPDGLFNAIQSFVSSIIKSLIFISANSCHSYNSCYFPFPKYFNSRTSFSFRKRHLPRSTFFLVKPPNITRSRFFTS